MRALTEMVYVDEIEVDQEGIAEMMLDENAIAQVARKLHLYLLQNILQEELMIPSLGYSNIPSQWLISFFPKAVLWNE